MKKIICYLLLSVFVGCTSSMQNTEEIDLLKNEVLQTDDVNAYIELGNTLSAKNRKIDILPYSIRMHRKNLGYYDFYINYLHIKLSEKCKYSDIVKLDVPEQEFLFYLLSKGAVSEDPECKKILIQYYKEGIVVEKNSAKADSIYRSFEYPN